MSGDKRQSMQKPGGPGATVDGEPEERAVSGELVGATLTVLSGGEAGRFFTVGPAAVLGRGDHVDVSFTDETVSREHARLELTPEGFLLTDLDSHNGTYVDGLKLAGSLVVPTRCRLQLGTRVILEFSALDELGLAAVSKLSNALLLDPLTGTGNRLHLERRLAAEVSYARRHGQPLGLMLLDLDHFKRINDTHGHLVGDRVLAQVGQALLSSVRTEDAVFRYGGEEFCILVRGLSEAGLMSMAERIRSLVAALEVSEDEQRVRVTVSIGVASLALDESPDADEILLTADRALYRAKQSGRDRVVRYVPPEVD